MSDFLIFSNKADIREYIYSVICKQNGNLMEGFNCFVSAKAIHAVNSMTTVEDGFHNNNGHSKWLGWEDKVKWQMCTCDGGIQKLTWHSLVLIILSNVLIERELFSKSLLEFVILKYEGNSIQKKTANKLSANRTAWSTNLHILAQFGSYLYHLIKLPVEAQWGDYFSTRDSAYIL